MPNAIEAKQMRRTSRSEVDVFNRKVNIQIENDDLLFWLRRISFATDED